MADIVLALAIPTVMLVLFAAADLALSVFFDVDMRRKRRRGR